MSLPRIATLKQYRHDGQRYHFVFPKEPKRKGQCAVIYCKRLARERVRWKRGKLVTEHSSTCTTCRCRLDRANHPARDAYRVIRDRAQRRGQIFDITFEQFMEIPRIEEYVQRRGRGIEDLHLDRVRVALGYVVGNLQVLTTAENLRKQREVDYCSTGDPF